MKGQLTESEEVQLSACLEEAGVKDLGGLLEFIRDAQGEDCEVDFTDPKLLNIEFPKPEGKLGTVFVHVVNEFTKHAHDHKIYPNYPERMGETKLSMNIGAVMGVATSTARKKIKQLSGTGWLQSKHKSIQNPVATYMIAFQEREPHPSFKR